MKKRRGNHEWSQSQKILKKLTAILTSVIMIMVMATAFALPQTAEPVYAADDDPVAAVSDMELSEQTGDFEEEPAGETAPTADEGRGDVQGPVTDPVRHRSKSGRPQRRHRRPRRQKHRRTETVLRAGRQQRPETAALWECGWYSSQPPRQALQ